MKLSVKQQAQELGISVQAMYKRLKKEGNVFRSDHSEEILELSDAGLSNTEIAHRLGIHRSSVYRILDRGVRFEKFLTIPMAPDYVIGTSGTVKHCPPTDFTRSLSMQGSGTLVRSYNGKVHIEGNDYKISTLLRIVHNQ